MGPPLKFPAFSMFSGHVFLGVFLAALPCSVLAGGAKGPPAECHPANLPMGGKSSAQIRGPLDLSAAGLAAWSKAMWDMRAACNSATGFDADAPDSVYNDPTLKWTQTAYMGPQMHPYDRFFYDPALGNGTGGAGYTVDRWLADLNARYGGIDQALIWPTYTNIGIDDRNSTGANSERRRRLTRELHRPASRLHVRVNRQAFDGQLVTDEEDAARLDHRIRIDRL